MLQTHKFLPLSWEQYSTVLKLGTDLLKTWCVRYLLVLLKGLPMIPFTRSPIFSAISS